MSWRVRLAGAKLEDIKAKLEDGVLIVTIPKDVKANTPRKAVMPSLMGMFCLYSE